MMYVVLGPWISVQVNVLLYNSGGVDASSSEDLLFGLVEKMVAVASPHVAHFNK